jgi:UPF0755 protein
MEQGKRAQRQQPDKAPPPPRARRKRNGGRLFSNPWTYLLFVFGISAILAALSWTAANDVLALNKPEHSAVITVSEDDSYSSVVNQLEDNGIIKYKTVFRIFSLFANGKEKMTPGTYVLNTEMDYHAIINGLGKNSDRRMTTTVTIPEGFTVDQIFKLLEEKGVSTVQKLQDMAGSHNYAFSFLQEVPLGDYHRLEGYLFPDTYEFYMGEDARFVLNKMLVNFDAKITDTMRKTITDAGYSLREIIIIASMIEKETDGQDRANISSVIRNRLKKPTNETAGYLNVDATIQYVLPAGEKVTTAHYDSVDSPYNTYKHKGLPPGPIANPGMESIIAAMNPAKTSFYYYALGEDDLHHFFKTFSEHRAFLGS